MQPRRSIVLTLLGKQPATFRSAYDLFESAQRLSAVIKRWPFINPFCNSTVGSIKPGKVTAWRSLAFSFNPLGPVFNGTLSESNGEVKLEGHFRMALYGRFFLITYFGMMLLMMIIMPIVVLSGAPIYSNRPVPLWQSQLFMLGLP